MLEWTARLSQACRGEVVLLYGEPIPNGIIAVVVILVDVRLIIEPALELIGRIN